ncbi:MAG: transposase [Ignavibacteria bacterium]
MKIQITQNLSETKNYFRENKSLSDVIKSLVINFTKNLIDTLLEEKIEFERTKALIKKNWYRNGYYTRHLITPFGLIENIKVPRLRNMFYENGIFHK